MSMMIHRWKVAKAAEKAASVASNNNTKTNDTVEDTKVSNEATESTAETKKYTKTEINRMTVLELQALAKANGIEDASEKSGADLKKILIAHFGL